jgi:hypothetical protein
MASIAAAQPSRGCFGGRSRTMRPSSTVTSASSVMPLASRIGFGSRMPLEFPMRMIFARMAPPVPTL